MSFIACTSSCVYQHDGCCNLEQAASGGVTSDTGCIHYVPKNGAKYDDFIAKKSSNIKPNSL
ncbi:MAG: hypothetical protein RSC43_08345 [Clostridia bacterium]